MLILLPASDRKNPVSTGAPFDPAQLSFPRLTPVRAAVLDALIEVSAAPDATRRLTEPAGMLDVVRRNVGLDDAPATAVEALYAGVLYDAIGFSDLDPAARRRARAWVVVISALWGALRLRDRVPSYRLNMCGRLPGLAHLTDVWREPLAEVLPDAARGGIVVDCRSSEYFTAWRPSGALAERTVVVRIVGDLDVKRGAASHAAKAMRGRLVRRIVTDGIDPPRPQALADALSKHFDVDLRRPGRPGREWGLDVVDSG